MPVYGNGSGSRNEFSYLKQGSEENGFLFKQDEGLKAFWQQTPTQTFLQCFPRPHPHHPTPGNFNTVRLNISSAVIKFWLWQNYQIIQNNLPKLGTWIFDFWNPHIMKFELIGSRNLHNKIKGNASRQRAVHLVTYYYYYCFYRTGAAAVPGWWYFHSPVNKHITKPP